MAVTKTIQDQVTELYVGFFGRAPDAAGMGYWAEKLGNGSATVTSIANEFAKTPEFVSIYGPLTPKEQVARIYTNVLDRAPDAAGEAYWVGQLNAGTPIGSVVYNIVNAAFQQVGTDDGLLVQNKVAVGEFFALVLSSNDTALAKTAYVGVTKDPATVTAKEIQLAEAAGTYTLTTGADTATASYFDGSAVVSPLGAFLQTLNNTDTLTGKGDNATLYAELVNANVTPLSLAKIKNVDVELGTAGGAATAINAINADSIKNVTLSNGGGAFTLNNLSTAVERLNINYATAGAVGVRSLASALVGTANAIAVTVTDSVLGGLTLSPLTGTNGYETINLVSNGAIANNLGGLTSAGTTTLNVAGAANMTTGQLSNTITTVDASAMTGNLIVQVGNGIVDVTGGSGNDTVVFNAGQFTTADVVDGGNGVNAIRAAYLDVVGLTVADANVTSIQTLQVSTASNATGTIRADLLGDSLNTVVFTNDTGTAAAVNTVRFATGANAVTYTDLLGGFTTAGAVTFDALTAEANGTSTSDSLLLTLDGENAVAAGIQTNDITIGNVILATGGREIETLNIVSNNATAFHTIGTITLPNTVGVIDTVNVSGASALAIGALTADKIDASGLTSGASLTMTAASLRAVNITGSAGNDTLLGSAVGDVISTGAGVDAVTAAGGADQVALGTGVDTVNQGTADSVALTTGAGTAGATISVGDVYTYANGIDLISGFAAGTGGDVLTVVGASVLPTAALGVANNALANNTNYFLSGTWNSGAGTFTITNNGIGADTMIIQGYGGAGGAVTTNASAVILVGIDSDFLVAANFA